MYAKVIAVIKQGHYRGWLPPKYVWFTYGWNSKGWWKEDIGNNSCTPEILRIMLNGSLAITPSYDLVSDDRHAITFSNLVRKEKPFLDNAVYSCCFFLSKTPEDFEEEYTRRLEEKHYQAQNLTEFILSGTEFDAVWAMALGLHHASKRAQINDSRGCDNLPGELVPLEDFDYLNKRMGCVFESSFQEVNFTGITVS